jgi:carotenoid cleavage dioxygenase-like enzyme
MARPLPPHPQLSGNYAPLRMECDAPDLIVHGELPRELSGTYYRNGPDPQYAPRGEHHWFAGDGMVHAFQFRDGRVAYRNRWVRTPKWQWEHEAGEALFDPFNPLNNDARVAGRDSTLANTNVVWHGGRLLALEEGHAPYELDPDTLESRGYWTFDGKLEGPMTAHPKLDPDSGQMLFFGYMATGPFSPDIRWHEVDAQGQLTRSETFQAPFSSMVHDFIVTRDHLVFPIFPLTGDLGRAMQGKPAFAWEPDKGTHIGIMRRDGSAAQMRWFEHEPCYVFHPMNAWTEGTTVVADVMKFEQAPLFPDPDGKPGDPAKSRARLTRWTFDLAANTDTVHEQQLDDLSGEFPRFDERRAGLPYRHGYYACSVNGGHGITFNAIAHIDLMTGVRRIHELGAADGAAEPLFVPRSARAVEGDGFVLAIVFRGASQRSELLVLDAQNVDREPIARIELSHRIPYGFHGNWRPNGE